MISLGENFRTTIGNPRQNERMIWHPRSFGNLQQLEVVEFYRKEVDPNTDADAEPWFGGPVRIQSDPEVPTGLNGPPIGLMVTAGSQGLSVHSYDFDAWIRQGGYSKERLR